MTRPRLLAGRNGAPAASGAAPVGLFIPCYIDLFYPDVGLATLEVLEGLGVHVDYPEQQTCCGQPMLNSGYADAARPLAARFVELFNRYEHVVCPSGSCVAMVRHHYASLLDGDDLARVKANTYELTEYLLDVHGIERALGRFPHRVGLHASCHGLRELRLGSSSELVVSKPDRLQRLLATLDGLELSEPERPDECCGFGGSFSVTQDAVSCMMGGDRIADHEQAGTDVLTATDMSCLMHLEGLIKRQRSPLRVMHVAQILAGRQPASQSAE